MAAFVSILLPNECMDQHTQDRQIQPDEGYYDGDNDIDPDMDHAGIGCYFCFSSNDSTYRDFRNLLECCMDL